MSKVENRRSRIEDCRVKTGSRLRFSVIDPLSSILHPRRCIGVLLFVVAIAGCEQQMADQPRYDPLESSGFFADGQSARPLVAGTVARGELREDDHFFTGLAGNAPAKTFPFPLTREVLQRGQERYDIYCSPCHARTGTGEGMIVQRGFSRPPSLHIDRLRDVPPGHLFVIISRGLGAMPSYSKQISAYDRWAITAYMRALQLSRNASLAEVPEELRQQLSRSEP
jgi:mono/diheme cytochrome c family protein